MNKLVEVVMCTFNGQKYIEKQLNSILQQSYPVSKISIYDDCSSDGTIDVIKKIIYQNKSEILIELHENKFNIGYIKNFINGVKKSSSDYVFLCDQDDLWSINKVKLFVERFSYEISSTPCLAFSNACIIDENDSSDGSNLWDKLKFKPIALKQELVKRNVITGATAVINKCLVEEVKKRKVSYDIPHDYSFAILAMAVGKILIIDNELTKYRIHGENQIGITKGGYNKIFNILTKVDQFYIERESLRNDGFLSMLGSGSEVRKEIITNLEEKRNLLVKIQNSFFIFTPFICIMKGKKYFSSKWSILKITYAVFRKNFSI